MDNEDLSTSSNPFWHSLETYWYLVLITLLLLFAASLGIFTAVEVSEGKFPGGLFLYKDLQVSTKKLGPVFREIVQHVETYSATLPKQVVYTCGGIFYDDPGLLVDENQHRASVGVFIRVRNSTVEAYFRDLGYKGKELPESLAVCTSHPNRLYKLGL